MSVSLSVSGPISVSLSVSDFHVHVMREIATRRLGVVQLSLISLCVCLLQEETLCDKHVARRREIGASDS